MLMLEVHQCPINLSNQGNSTVFSWSSSTTRQLELLFYRIDTISIQYQYISLLATAKCDVKVYKMNFSKNIVEQLSQLLGHWWALKSFELLLVWRNVKKYFEMQWKCQILAKNADHYTKASVAWGSKSERRGKCTKMLAVNSLLPWDLKSTSEIVLNSALITVSNLWWKV